MLEKLLLAFLERDRIYDALALQAFETGLDHGPIRRIHHERDLGDLRLAAQQLQITGHGRDAVDHALIHADVENVGPILDLLTGHADRLFVFAFLDQLGEFGRTSHVGPFADEDEDAGLLRERLRAGETKRPGCRDGDGLSGRLMLCSRSGGCMIRRSRMRPTVAGAGLRELWRSLRCVPGYCRSIRLQY